MKQNKKQQKGKSGLAIVGFAIVMFVTLVSELSDDALFSVLWIFITLIPVIVLLSIVMIVKKLRRSSEAVHSHDRIDHRKDLTINPETGKVQSAPVRHQPHSSREHWKQQLDGLLENGTIDKAEYKAMMNRRF